VVYNIVFEFALKKVLKEYLQQNVTSEKDIERILKENERLQFMH